MSVSLETAHPFAVMLLRRAMIENTLDGAKSKCYRHAARHLAECKASDPAITDHGHVPDPEPFVETFRQGHGRKHGFWHLMDG